MRYEFYFYKDETEMILDQGKRAVEYQMKSVSYANGIGWKVMYSGKIEGLHWGFFNQLELTIPHATTYMVVIKNEMI